MIVGALDGSDTIARAVVEAVRWMKSSSPAAVRHDWIVSALPNANPDRHAVTAPFPPVKGYFDDPEQPETRYAWRWVTFQAPDLVVVKSGYDPASDAFAKALGDRSNGNPGVVPAMSVDVSDIPNALPALLGAVKTWSPLHQAIAARSDRDPLAVARVLARRYPQSVVSSYIPSVAWTNMLRLATITGEDEWRAKVRQQTAPWTSGAKKPLAGDTLPTSIAGYMIYPELSRLDDNAETKRLIAEGVELAAAKKPSGEYANGRGWTDDMFMATSVLARSGSETRLDEASRTLAEYAGRLHGPTASSITPLTDRIPGGAAAASPPSA